MTPQLTLLPKVKRTLRVAGVHQGTRKAASYWVFLAFLALDRERIEICKSVSYNDKFKHNLLHASSLNQRSDDNPKASSGLVRPDVCGVLCGKLPGHRMPRLESAHLEHKARRSASSHRGTRSK